MPPQKMAPGFQGAGWLEVDGVEDGIQRWTEVE